MPKEHTFGSRLRAARQVLKLTQQEVADKLAVTAQAVSQWERDETQPDFNNLVALMRVVNLTPLDGVLLTGDLSDGERRVIQRKFAEHDRLVPLVGYVGAGDEVHYYAVEEGHLDEISAPHGTTDKTVTAEIRGDSLGAIFDRWLVFYDDARTPVTPGLIGKLCVVGTADGRVLIKKLRTGRRPNHFTLLSERKPPIEDVPLKWATEVTAMVPK